MNPQRLLIVLTVVNIFLVLLCLGQSWQGMSRQYSEVGRLKE